MAVTFHDSSKGQSSQITTEVADVTHPQLVREHKQSLGFWFGELASVELTLPGIQIEYGSWNINQAMNAEISSDEECVEMQFTLSGKGEIRDLDSGHTYGFSQNQQNLYNLPGFTGHGGYQKGQFTFFEIKFSKSYFLQLAEQSSALLMEFANSVIGSKIKAVSQANRPISLAMHQCINDIMHSPFTGGLQHMFLQSKCIELLVLQAQSHETAIVSPALICKSTYDQRCIQEAREYLLQHADNPPSLTELAKIVGLNEYKLKKGFKEKYQHTVFGYLNDYRLEQARQLLLDRAQPIKDIAHLMGYSSVPHFTKAFKKKFGLPPGLAKRC